MIARVLQRWRMRRRQRTPKKVPRHPDPSAMGWFRLVWWAACRVHGSGERRALTRRLRFVLRACITPRMTEAWILSIVDGRLQPLSEQVPRLFGKPGRLYLNRHWRAARRHRVLRDHYDWLCRAFTPAQMMTLYRDEGGLSIATLPALGRRSVTLHLRYDAAHEREGEMALSLRADGRVVATLVFTLGRDGVGRRQLMVGAVQSRGGEDALDLAREITHALHGLRPKALLVAAVQMVAAAAGVARVLAVADRAHVFEGIRYALKRHLLGRHRKAARYDRLWAECGGEPRDDGFYELATRPARRDLASARSNKRSMYRRRYALLDSMSQQLGAAPIDWSAGTVVNPSFAAAAADLRGDAGRAVTAENVET